MLHFHDRAGFARALTLDLDPRLRSLLAARINGLTDDLIDLTELLIIEAGDTEADIVARIGLSPLVEPIDGARFGEPGFAPHWDSLTAHNGFYEFVFTFGSTFALLIIVPDSAGVIAELRRLCAQYASARELRASSTPGS